MAAVYRTEASPNERRELAEALRLRPDLLQARIALSRALLAAKDAAGAVAILDQAPAQQKNLGALILQRNWALLAAGDVPEARAGVNRLLTAGRLPEVVLQDGQVKLAEKQYSAALAAAEELLVKQPENVQAAALIADTYAAEKQPAKAVERIRRLANDRRKSVQLQMLLGRVSLFAGDRAEARKAFEAAKVAAPQSSAADLALAELDFSDGRFGDAKQKLAIASAAEPRNARVLLLGAHAELRSGSKDAAMAKYRSVLGVDPNNLIALNNLAYLLAPDSPDEALKLGEQALAAAPDYAPVHDTLGYVYYRKGLYRRAVEYLKTAVAKEPTPARQYHLGMSYVKAGDMNTGSDLITVAVKRDPNLPKTEQGW
jgi:tetratricopeptide (TPR) repeat protein